VSEEGSEKRILFLHEKEYAYDQIKGILSGKSYSVGSFLLRCPSCNKIVVGQGFSSPHPYSRRRKYLNEWQTVVIDVLIKKNFVCFHCGKSYKV